MSMSKKDLIHSKSLISEAFSQKGKILKLCKINRAISWTDSKNCLTRFLYNIRIKISVKDTSSFLFSSLSISLIISIILDTIIVTMFIHWFVFLLIL